MFRVAVSGGFDPIHIGHVRYLLAAAQMGNLVVILNSDEWLIRKKGKVFMPYTEREEILRSYPFVKEVIPAIEDKEGTIAPSLRLCHPDVFAKGGDRDLKTIPQAEIDACREYGIILAVFVGGGKVQSSSSLLRKWEKTLDFSLPLFPRVKGTWTQEGHFFCSKCNSMLGFSSFLGVLGSPGYKLEAVKECEKCHAKFGEGIWKWKEGSKYNFKNGLL